MSLSAAEVEAAVEREGLTLVQSADSNTGYQLVGADRRRFRASGVGRPSGLPPCFVAAPTAGPVRFSFRAAAARSKETSLMGRFDIS